MSLKLKTKSSASHYGRFKDLPSFNRIAVSTVMIFGQGGIGSHLAFFLARTGADLILVDFDTVDESNLAGQLYGKEDVGKPKVNAMVNVITRLCGETKVTAMNVQATEDENTQWYALLNRADVVCVTFDSIAARSLVFSKWLKNKKETSLFVDGRMGAQQGQVFAVPSNSSEKVFADYTDTFFNDNEIPELPCTAKATTHCGSLTASLMTSTITNWMQCHTPGAMPATVLPRFDFFLPLMMFDDFTTKT